MGRILVTGGVGFIGYHVTRALLARGDEVVVLDDFSEGPYPRGDKRRNEADLRREFPACRIVEGCVTERAVIGPLFVGQEAVLHLAGLAGVRPSFADPARYARVNVEGTAVVQELARVHRIDRFVFASSSSVYGNSTELPAREDAPAVVPESPYAASKRSRRSWSRRRFATTALDMRCSALRFFTVYGARQRPEMAITLFARAAIAGRPIAMFGDGSMRRDFTHVDDIVSGVLAAVDQQRAPGVRAYNLGSGAPFDLTSLVAAIGAAAGVKLRVEATAVPLGDVDATYADISRARDELGWKPRVDLATGLGTVLEWVREHSLPGAMPAR